MTAPDEQNPNASCGRVVLDPASVFCHTSRPGIGEPPELQEIGDGLSLESKCAGVRRGRIGRVRFEFVQRAGFVGGQAI